MVEVARRAEPPTRSTRFQGLYAACHARVLAYCVRRVGYHDAPDVVAEVFEVAWRRLDNIPEGEAELPWLYGVAYRVVSHHWRSQQRRRRLATKLGSLQAEPSTELETIVIRHRDFELVMRAAARLRPTDQEVLRLALWEGLNHQQIADLMASTVPAVRQRFHRAKRALVREFERAGGIIPPTAVAQEEGER